uniref:Ig-like domain-containing protein n=1 Tax=Sparus aurata TaxID=8175 RepID=A0A671UPA8_SPAAU
MAATVESHRSLTVCLQFFQHYRNNFGGLYLLFTSVAPDVLFGYIVGHCQFTSSDDLVYLAQVYFNKKLMGEYNSTVGKYTGYTEKAILCQVFFMSVCAETLKFFAESSCLLHVKTSYERTKTVTVEPSVSLSSFKAVDSKHPSTLICSAYKFFPKQIRVTWLRNGKEVTSDVTSTEEMPNGGWLYQIHTVLEYTPRLGETITCKVEHASLMEPLLYEWEPMPESQRNKIAVGTAGLLLGLVIFVGGLIYYKKNSSGKRNDQISLV